MYLWRYVGVEEYFLSPDAKKPEPYRLIGELKLSGEAKQFIELLKTMDEIAGNNKFRSCLNDVVDASITLVKKQKRGKKQ